MQCLSAQESLFKVIFDFVAFSMTVEKEQDPQACAALLSLLRQLNAPYHFSCLTKYVPLDFGMEFSQFMQAETLAKEKEDQPLVKYDKSALRTLMRTLETLFLSEQCLLEEVEDNFDHMISNSDSADSDVAKLKQYLCSDVRQERVAGQNWLFEILSLAETQPERVPASLLRRLHALLGELRSHAQPQVRRCFLTLVDRLLHLQKAQIKSHGDADALTGLMERLNSLLSPCVDVEKDPQNLLCILLTIFQHISLASLYYDLEPADTILDLFVRGSVRCNHSLVHCLDTKLLLHIFSNLGQEMEYRRGREVALVLLCEICRVRDEPLQLCGGTPFFRTLLDDPQPEIAYHASRFVLEQLVTQRPEQYRAMLPKVIATAQKSNNEQLLDNPYLQIRFITDLMRQ